NEPDPEPRPEPLRTPTASPRRRRLVRPRPLAVAACAVFLLTSSTFPLGPTDAAAPLTDPLVLAKERRDNARQAEAARLSLLAGLQEAGIAGRRISSPAPARSHRVSQHRVLASHASTATAQPQDALGRYLESLGPNAILAALDA